MPEGRDRIRTLRACGACSARKVKCDGNDECGSCLKLGMTCVYVTSGKKRGPPKGSPARGGVKKRGKDGKTSDKTTNGDGVKPSPLVPAARVYSLPSSGRTHSADDPMPLGIDVPFDVGDMMGDLLFDSSRVQIKSPPLPSSVEMPFNSLPNVSASVTVPNMPVDARLQDSFARAAGLTDESIDKMLLLYETFIHPHWPIIYLPALRSFRDLEQRSPLVFDALLALAAATSQEAQLVAASGVLHESVRQRILASFVNGANIATIQALILVVLVDMGYNRVSMAYQMGGIACRMAIDLGLHTQLQPEFATAPPLRAGDGRRKQEQSRSLWACYVLDKILAAVLQRPPMLRAADIDAPRPSTMERDELDLWLGGGAQAYLSPAYTVRMESVKSHALSSFNAWCDLMVILERILDKVYRPAARRARMDSLHAVDYDEIVVPIDTLLREWRSELPYHLQWSDDERPEEVNVGSHILTMRGWFYTCMLLLHRPRVPYLETPHSPDDDAAEALQQLQREDQKPAHVRLPKGVDATWQAATGINLLMEAYENIFSVRRFPSAWVYLVFQAATVHAGLACMAQSDIPLTRSNSRFSPGRAEAMKRLDQCVNWLEQIASTWSTVSQHVDILRTLSAVGARTRPPSPAPQPPADLFLSDPGWNPTNADSASSVSSSTLPVPQQITPTPFDVVPSTGIGTGTTGEAMGLNGMADADLNAWMLFWASMPTASEDPTLWQSFNHMFNA